MVVRIAIGNKFCVETHRCQVTESRCYFDVDYSSHFALRLPNVLEALLSAGDCEPKYSEKLTDLLKTIGFCIFQNICSLLPLVTLSTFSQIQFKITLSFH